MASVIEGLKNLLEGDGRKVPYDKTPLPPTGFDGMTESEKLATLVAQVRLMDGAINQRRDLIHYQCALYYQGYQNVQMSADGNSLDVFDNDTQYIENQFRKHVDTVKEMLNSLEPEVIARPGSDSPKDIGAARCAEPALEMISDNIAYERLKDQKNLYKCLFGTSFQFTDYIVDPKYGTVLSPKYSYSDVPDPEIEGEVIPTKVMEGTEERDRGMEVAVICSPLEVKIPSDIKGGMQNLPWLQWRSRHDLEQLNYTYPGLNEGASNYERGLAAQYMEILGNLPGNTVGSGSPMYSTTIGQRQKGELARTWLKPCMFRGDKALEKKFPNGVHVATVNGRVVDYYPETLEDRWTLEVLIPLPHSMLGDGLYDTILQQDQLNEVNALLVKNIKFSTVGHNFYDGSMFDANIDIVNDPENAWVKVNVAADRDVTKSVHSVKPNTLAAEAFAWPSVIREAMQDMSSAYNPSQGKSLGANTPYSQSVFLAEKAQGRWKSTSSYNKPELLRFWRQLLKIAQTEWIDERTRAIIDDTGKWSFEQFSTSNLAGNVDIRLTNTDFQPKSRAEQMQALEQRMALEPMWLSLPPRQKLRIEEMLGLPPETNPQSNQMMRAFRTIERIKNGEVVTPLPMVDDPTTQIPVFQDFLVSEKGEDLAMEDPEAYANIYTYMMTLLMMGMQAMGAGLAPHPTMKPEMGAQGGGSGKPGEQKQPGGQEGQEGGGPKAGVGQEEAQSPIPNKQPAPPPSAETRQG